MSTVKATTFTGKAQNILIGVKAEIKSVTERLEVAMLPGVNRTPEEIQDLKDRLAALKQRQKQLEGKVKAQNILKGVKAEIESVYSEAFYCLNT